jgi:F-type H+-transporting ATPase subunit delta
VATMASAKRHAQAVFQLALENDSVDRWRSELTRLAETLAEPELAAILEDPKLHADQKMELIRKCLPGLTQQALNLAFFLVARQRLGIVGQILAAYEIMANAKEGLEHAKVVTAVPLDEKETQSLMDRLAKITGKRIVLDTDVDPDIIGGFVARIGDKLIDGSTKARLGALKKGLARREL